MNLTEESLFFSRTRETLIFSLIRFLLTDLSILVRQLTQKLIVEESVHQGDAHDYIGVETALINLGFSMQWFLSIPNFEMLPSICGLSYSEKKARLYRLNRKAKPSIQQVIFLLVSYPTGLTCCCGARGSLRVPTSRLFAIISGLPTNQEAVVAVTQKRWFSACL